MLKFKISVSKNKKKPIYFCKIHKFIEWHNYNTFLAKRKDFIYFLTNINMIYLTWYFNKKYKQCNYIYMLYHVNYTYYKNIIGTKKQTTVHLK